MVRRDDDAGVAGESLKTSCGIEHRAQRSVDTFDNGQRARGSDFVAAVIVVRKIGDGEVAQPAGCNELTQHRAARFIVHPETVQRAAAIPNLVTTDLRGDEVAEAQVDGPLMVAVRGTPGNSDIIHGTFT